MLKRTLQSACIRYSQLFQCTFEVWELKDAIQTYRDHHPRLEADFAFEQPALVTLCPGQHLLFIPFSDLGSVDHIATAMLLSDSPAVYLNFAKTFFEKQNLKNQLAETRFEREELVRQVTRDFEELNFFRVVAPELASRVSTRDIAVLAKTIFEMVEVSTCAESLYYVQNDHPNGLVRSDSLSILARQGVEREEQPVLGLVEQLHSLDGQPVVFNELGSASALSASDGISGLIIAPVLKDVETIGWLVAINRIQDALSSSPVPDEFGSHEATILASASTMLSAFMSNVQMLIDRETMFTDVVATLVSTIEAKDPYTCGHSERVADYSRRLAELIGFDSENARRVYLSGLLHDIGKISIPDSILQKQSRLSDEEFAIVKQHPVNGWNILKGLKTMQSMKDGVLYHHESFDGTGYPAGLAKDKIPIDGRILAIADAFDAMTSDRPYRSGMPVEKAAAIIREGADKQWDGHLVSIFLRSLDEFVQIKNSHEAKGQQTSRAVIANLLRQTQENTV